MLPGRLRCGQVKVRSKFYMPIECLMRESAAIGHTDFREAVAFINKIAAPVLNKMFDCGMIP